MIYHRIYMENHNTEEEHCTLKPERSHPMDNIR